MVVVDVPTEPTPAVDAVAKELIGSPKAMAAAVLAEAQRNLELSQQSQQEEEDEPTANDDNEQETATSGGSHKKRPRISREGASSNSGQEDNDDDDEQLQDKDALASVWSTLKNGNADDAHLKEKALGNTISLVNNQIEALVQQGLRAYHDWERLNHEVARANEVVESKDLELKRLRSATQQNQTSISHLTTALESAKTESRDAARLIQAEARLRADLGFLRSERNEALASAAEAKRKVELLQEEARVTKAKLARMAADKLKTERDSRAALSLAQSLNNGNQSNDVDFYKRKASELNNDLQSEKALVAEQQYQIDEMRQQIERSMSQNRLSNMRNDESSRR